MPCEQGAQAMLRHVPIQQPHEVTLPLRVDRLWHAAKRPETIVSEETRRVEFELHVPEGTPPGKHTIPVYALYYVCESVNSACLFRRGDFGIEVEVVKN